jgi:hypothetical protein
MRLVGGLDVAQSVDRKVSEGGWTFWSGLEQAAGLLR